MSRSWSRRDLLAALPTLTQPPPGSEASRRPTRPARVSACFLGQLRPQQWAAKVLLLPVEVPQPKGNCRPTRPRAMNSTPKQAGPCRLCMSFDPPWSRDTFVVIVPPSPLGTDMADRSFELPSRGRPRPRTASPQPGSGTAQGMSHLHEVHRRRALAFLGFSIERRCMIGRLAEF